MTNYNIKTLINGRTEGSTKNATSKQITELTHIAENQLKKDKCFIINAEINYVVVQLRTNDPHLRKFWELNWFKPKKSATPEITIWAVTGIKNKKPHAYYNSNRKQAVFINTNYYGQCKSWALGAVADYREKGCGIDPKTKKIKANINEKIHSLHSACVELNGECMVIIAPTGTGKSTLTYGMLSKIKNTQLHSDDWIYIRYLKNKSIADISEKQFYMRTNMVEEFPKLKKVFDKSPVENVKGSKGKRDYMGTPNSRVMIDPKLLGKTCIGKKSQKSQIKYVILLRRNKYSPAVLKLKSSQAIKILDEGAYSVQPGAGPKKSWNKTKYEPWYNPYLLVRNKNRNEVQKKFFKLLFKVAECYIINTGVISVKDTLDKMKSIIAKKEKQ